MPEVFVGLGANVGDPEANLRAAVARLGAIIDVAAISSLHRSEPVGIRDQPLFLNAVLGGTTDLGARELVATLLQIERELGRERIVPMGPRTIDLDLLLYGDTVLEEGDVTVPHPRMAERGFVLVPLAEIAPDAVHPVLGRTAGDLLGSLEADDLVERIEAEDWPPPDAIE